MVQFKLSGLLICFIMCKLCSQDLQKSSSSRKGDQAAGEKSSLESIQSSVPLFLQYPVPYTQDAPTPLLVSQSPTKLHFGNPYSISDSKGWFISTKLLKKSSEIHIYLFTMSQSRSKAKIMYLSPTAHTCKMYTWRSWTVLLFLLFECVSVCGSCELAFIFVPTRDKCFILGVEYHISTMFHCIIPDK